MFRRTDGISRAKCATDGGRYRYIRPRCPEAVTIAWSKLGSIRGLVTSAEFYVMIYGCIVLFCDLAAAWTCSGTEGVVPTFPRGRENRNDLSSPLLAMVTDGILGVRRANKPGKPEATNSRFQ